MTLTQALEITGPLQEASKMPCYCYSIARKWCKRGSKLAKVIGSVCNKCYAARGNFIRPTIIQKLDKHMQAMAHPLWSEAMALVLTVFEMTGYFRWYASGDLQSLEDLLKICDVCKRTPHIKHWLPTHEVGILNAFVRAGFSFPKNLVVRLSADMIEGKPNPITLKRLGILGGVVSKKRWNCPAPSTYGMCQTCRKCWHRKVKVVTYKYH